MTIRSNLDSLLMAHPNSLVFITGDFNPTATGLDLKDLTQPNNLSKWSTSKLEIVILDWVLTNKIARRDHFTVLASPITCNTSRRQKPKLKVRDERESARACLRALANKQGLVICSCSRIMKGKI